MKTEREKMLDGEMYEAWDPELVEMRMRARGVWQRLNGDNATDATGRLSIVRELLGNIGEGAIIEPPFFCDYGAHISLGAGAYVNMNCVFLDPAPIVIGEQAFLGPAVQLYTATHPIDAATRVAGPEYALPIAIGARSWIGGGTIVCPGVTIGENTTIGAGSVVTRNIPANVVAAGNPCRVMREL
jgi:maltose O-acetyltransferase